jgi:hypothetical protein
MYSGARHNFIAGFQAGHKTLMLLLLFLLRANHQKVHDDPHESEHQKRLKDIALWSSGSRRRGLLCEEKNGGNHG